MGSSSLSQGLMHAKYLYIHISGKIGAGDGIRTHDPNLGKVVLYP